MMVFSWLFVLICLGVIWANRASSADLLLDSDTRGLLIGIRERGNALSWFWTDWPIFNHFYRPFPSLAFELDLWLHGSNAAGYGATNAFLVMLCVGLVAWVGAVWFRSPVWGALGAGIFTLWLLPSRMWSPSLIVFVVLAYLLAGNRRLLWWQATCLLLLVWIELNPIESLYFRSVGWLPGRTATIMAVFAVFALGAFICAARSGSRGCAWAGLASTAAALASYEQAVMLPMLFAVFAFAVRKESKLNLWPWVAGSWLVLVAYLALRYQIIPPGVSRYQDQQFRLGPGVWLSLSAYFTPPLAYWTSLRIAVESGLVPFLVSGAPWWAVTQFPAYIGSAVSLTRQKRWVTPFALWAMSSLAFAPMAFLKPFEHYHFFPMALRAMLVVSLLHVLMVQDEADE